MSSWKQSWCHAADPSVLRYKFAFPLSVIVVSVKLREDEGNLETGLIMSGEERHEEQIRLIAQVD